MRIDSIGEVSLRLARSTGFELEASFEVPTSGITVLFGPSGCGKTTVLRCVAGLERANGRVQIGDKVWQDDEKKLFVPTYERSLGYVFQEASLFAHLNVEKNLHFGLNRAKVADGQERLRQAVDLLGIEKLLKRRVDELSGGERQRCAIARALCLRPDIILMDEPLAALDWARKREILPWLEKLRGELQIPILYVTHSADEMARLADRVILMKDGKVAAQGPLSDVLTNLTLPVSFEHGPSAVLAGTVEAVDAEWKTVVVDAGGWKILLADQHEAGRESAGTGLAAGAHVRLRILAKDVSLALAEPQMTSIRNQLPAAIEEMSGLDAESPYVHVKLRSPEGVRILARVLRRSADELQLNPGLKVWAQVKAAAVVS